MGLLTKIKSECSKHAKLPRGGLGLAQVEESKGNARGATYSPPPSPARGAGLAPQRRGWQAAPSSKQGGGVALPSSSGPSLGLAESASFPLVYLDHEGQSLKTGEAPFRGGSQPGKAP